MVTKEVAASLYTVNVMNHNSECTFTLLLLRWSGTIHIMPDILSRLPAPMPRAAGGVQWHTGTAGPLFGPHVVMVDRSRVAKRSRRFQQRVVGQDKKISHIGLVGGSCVAEALYRSSTTTEQWVGRHVEGG